MKDYRNVAYYEASFTSLIEEFVDKIRSLHCDEIPVAVQRLERSCDGARDDSARQAFMMIMASFFQGYKHNFVQ